MSRVPTNKYTHPTGGQKTAPTTTYHQSPVSKPVPKLFKKTKTRGLLVRKRDTGNLMPDNLTAEYVHRIFNTRTRERNTDETILRFLREWQDVCKATGIVLPEDVYNMVEAQKRDTLRFGRLDFSRVSAQSLSRDHIEALAKACVKVPVVRTILLSTHPKLKNTKTVQCFINAMEAQLQKWTSIIPLSIRKRRRRASILLEKRVQERVHAANNKKEKKQINKEANNFDLPTPSKLGQLPNDWKEDVEDVDMYLSGTANKVEKDGMPIFLLQEIKLADIQRVSSTFHPKRHRNSLLQPTFARNQGIRRNPKKEIKINKRISEILSEVSKMMTIANSELEARRLFHDFDANQDGILTEHEVHHALRSLGLSVSPEESKRMLDFIATAEHNHITEEDFVSVVAYRVRGALVKKHVADSYESLLPKQKYVLHPMSSFMQSWDLVMIFLLIACFYMTPLEVAFIEASNTGFWFWFNRTIDVVFWHDLFLHFFLMYPKSNRNASQAKWTITWERNHSEIAKEYLKNWFIIDFVSCIPFDLIAVAAASSQISGLASNLRMLRVLRLLRISKIAKILQGGRQFKRFERWLSLRHIVAETVRVVCVMFFCVHWTACLWSTSFNIIVLFFYTIKPQIIIANFCLLSSFFLLSFFLLPEQQCWL